MRCSRPTEALRLRSGERLATDLYADLRRYDRGGEVDYRDVLLTLAPHVDCARRLSVDPVALFDAASQGCSPEMSALALEFARRTDVTLDAFGWRLDQEPDGPCYRFAP